MNKHATSSSFLFFYIVTLAFTRLISAFPDFLLVARSSNLYFTWVFQFPFPSLFPYPLLSSPLHSHILIPCLTSACFPSISLFWRLLAPSLFASLADINYIFNTSFFSCMLTDYSKTSEEWGLFTLFFFYLHMLTMLFLAAVKYSLQLRNCGGNISQKVRWSISSLIACLIEKLQWTKLSDGELCEKLLNSNSFWG